MTELLNSGIYGGGKVVVFFEALMQHSHNHKKKSAQHAVHGPRAVPGKIFSGPGAIGLTVPGP
jgi:hypothetical protein